MEKNISVSNYTINIHEIIEIIRNQLLQKSILHISNKKSINLFNEIKPLSVNDFQQELSKYNISLDSSYINSVISQINAQLFNQLLARTEQNILKDLIDSSNNLIKTLTYTDLIQNYELNLDDKNMNEILTYVNAGIKNENKIRNRNIKYKRLTECFIELAETNIQKEAIEQIMKNGEYNGFKLNSMLSNKKYDENIERERRIAFAEMAYIMRIFSYIL